MAETSKPMEGVVDYRGIPIFSRSAAGGWTSAAFIIWVVVLERFAYYGISINLISYLTGPLGESTAAAATNLNAWNGVSLVLPLLGGFFGDSFGRHLTVVYSSLLYVLGLGMLASSAAGKGTWLPARLKTAFFFSAMYLVSLAQGGHKPCVQAFGAANSTGMIQTSADREAPSSTGRSSARAAAQHSPSCSCPISRITSAGGSASGCLVSQWRSHLLSSWLEHAPILSTVTLPTSRRLRSKNRGNLLTSTTSEVSWRGLLRLLPIWATCSLYAVVLAQSSTFFTKQGSTVDRRISSSFLVPPAALQSFINISVLAFLPVYDRLLVPLFRSFTGHPSGLGMLQRVGIGMLLSISAMITAALVEKKRLQTARDFGLVAQPDSAIPMSLWWFLPQYIILGISDVFTMVGLQEFFYDQVPSGMRGLGSALFLSTMGMGSVVSGFLVWMLQKVSAWCGEDWFSDNLNKAHLDYFYWFLASLSFIDFLLYLYVASSYRYKVRGRG